MNVKGRKIGQDYEFETIKPPLRFTVSAVRESQSGLWAEIHVQSIQSGNEGDILRDHITLTSTRSTNSLAKTLAARTKVAMSWPELIALICLTTIDTFRQGDPFLYLKQVPDTPQDRAYLVERLIPYQQTVVIYGDGGAGKSLFALSTAIAVATGKKLPGIKPNMQPYRVLYLDYEATPAVHAYYLHCIEKGEGIEIDSKGIVYRRMSRALTLESALIKREVDRQEIGFLVVDSMVPACGGEPESANIVMQFFNAIRGIGPISTLVVSHLTKAEAQRKGLPRPFGSVFTTNLARSTWLARRAEIGDSDVLEIGLYHTKTNFGRLFEPQGIRYRFGSDSIIMSQFYLDEVPELGEHMPLSRRIRGILKEGPSTVKEIADTLGALPGSVSKSLRRMKDTTVLRGDSSGGRGKVKSWVLQAKDEEPPPEQRAMDDIPF